MVMKNKKEMPKTKTAKNKDRKEGRKWKRNRRGDKSQQGQERQKPGWGQGKKQVSKGPKRQLSKGPSNQAPTKQKAQSQKESLKSP